MIHILQLRMRTVSLERSTVAVSSLWSLSQLVVEGSEAQKAKNGSKETIKGWSIRTDSDMVHYPMFKKLTVG